MKRNLLFFFALFILAVTTQAQTTYYWRPAANGSNASPNDWTISTNWNTAPDGTGSVRTTPAVNDFLIFDGNVIASGITGGVVGGDNFVAFPTTETVGTLQFVNSAKISFVRVTYSTTPLGDIATSSLYGNCTYSVTTATGNFTNLKAGDVITSYPGAGSIPNPFPFGQVLATLDATNMTISKEGATLAVGAQYYLVPTLYADILTVDATSTLQFASTSTSSAVFFPFVINTKGGAIAGKVIFQSRGGHGKLVCTTPNGGSTTAGLRFTSGSSCQVNASTTSRDNYNLGNTLGKYTGSTFLFDNGSGASATPGYTGNAGIVFESGSTFIMGTSAVGGTTTGQGRTPLGASYEATSPLTYSPAVAFLTGSTYVHGHTSRNSGPYFINDNVNVSYPNLVFNSVFPTIINLNKVESLTANGTLATPPTNSGSFIATGSIANNSSAAINFGNVLLGGTTSQTMGGTSAVAFSTFIVADKAEATLANSITATNVHLLGKMNFGNNTITGPGAGSGIFATYSPYSKSATVSFTLTSAVISGINNNGAGTTTYEYPVGATIANSAYLPAGTIYRAYSSGVDGLMSSYATGTAINQPAVFSIAGSSYTTSSGSLEASAPGFTYVLNVNASALPLDLISFAGDLSGNAVNLQWKTENEASIGLFIVEKRNEGETDFREIGKVDAQNQSSNSYAFFDRTIGNGSRAYYRLKIVERDGRFKYSFIRTVVIKTGFDVKIFPNPASTTLVLTNLSATSTGKVVIYAADGRSVISVVPEKNSVETSINIAGLAKGTYFLNYSNDNLQTVIRFVKK